MFAANDVPDDEIAKMTHENAMRWYSFDPFAHVPKDEATVGALRAQAAGHDVSIMSRSTRVAHARREARGLPPAGPPGRRRAGLTPAHRVGSVSPQPVRPARPDQRSSPGRPGRAASRPAPRRRRGRGPRRWRGRRPRRPADRLEQGGVLGPAPALLLGEQLEVAGRHHPHGLAQVGQQAGRARGQVEGPVEAPVGGHHVVAVDDGVGQRVAARPAARSVIRVGGPLGRLAGQRGQHGEVVDRVLGRDADHGDPAARGDRHQALVGQLEQRLAHRGAAGAELLGDLVEVEAGARRAAGR